MEQNVQKMIGYKTINYLARYQVQITQSSFGNLKRRSKTKIAPFTLTVRMTENCRKIVKIALAQSTRDVWGTEHKQHWFGPWQCTGVNHGQLKQQTAKYSKHSRWTCIEEWCKSAGRSMEPTTQYWKSCSRHVASWQRSREGSCNRPTSVSYTHLTLPTKRIV